MADTQKEKPKIISDVIAGMTASIPSVPDAMASGVLAGISPIYGLYGLMIGTPVAALFTGSAFMSVVTTSAMAITIGTTLVNYQGDEQISALVTIDLVIGVVQLLAGLLRLEFLVRYVSNAVMTGFLSGLGVLIVLSRVRVGPAISRKHRKGSGFIALARQRRNWEHLCTCAGALCLGPGSQPGKTGAIRGG